MDFLMGMNPLLLIFGQESMGSGIVLFFCYVRVN